MSKRMKAGIAAGILAVICIGVFVYISQTVKGATKDNKIVRGVIFEGKSLGGMTKEEAKKEIEDDLQKEQAKDIYNKLNDSGFFDKVKSWFSGFVDTIKGIFS